MLGTLPVFLPSANLKSRGFLFICFGKHIFFIWTVYCTTPSWCTFWRKKIRIFFLLLPRTTASLNVRKQVQLFFLLSFFLIGYTFAYMTDSLIRDIFSLLCAGCTQSSAPVLAAERERNKVVLGYVTHHKDLCHFAALSSDTYNHSRYDSKNNGILTLRFGLFPLQRFTVVHARRVCVVYNRLQVLTISVSYTHLTLPTRPLV